MKKIVTTIMAFAFIFSFTACEKDTAPRNIIYSVKGLTSDYKITYRQNGENFSEVVNGGEDTKIMFQAERGEVLYFDIKYKDDVNKMSNFAAMITVNKTILKESYAYDMKWADSATVDIPYPFEIILSTTVPY